MDVPSPAQRLLPTPTALRTGEGSLTFDESSVIDVGRRPRRGTLAAAEHLAGLLRPPTGWGWEVQQGGPVDGTRVVLRRGGPQSLGREGYRLDAGRRTVTIEARTGTGLFRGVQTLRQLLPAAVERRERVADATWSVPRVHVTDVPRYPVRAAMLDVVRHFFDVEDVKRFIDAMVPLKLNTLLLHLSDDQGWRLEVTSWPRLTTYGGALEVGGTEGGWYSQEDFAELVAYVRERRITVVPEIDLPGHTNAALASYPVLNADGVAPERYTGTEVGFSSLDAGLEATDRFLADVLGEVAALTPGRYVSIGGDEAHSTSRADYAAMVDRAQAVLRAHGKRMWGWHQTAAAHPARGSVSAYWGTSGSTQDAALARRAARRGQRLVLAPAEHAYLDMRYDPDFPHGLAWTGDVGVPRAYAWDPATLLPDVPAAAVAGVLAPVWTETLGDLETVELMVFHGWPVSRSSAGRRAAATTRSTTSCSSRPRGRAGRPAA